MNESGWVVFGVTVLGMLALDLGVFNRKAHAPSLRQAAGWSVFWVTLGLAFGGYVTWAMGTQAGGEYFAAWLLEKSLSVDNLFVISVIFTWFKVADEHRHRVLFWGVLGAIVTRGLFIGLGIEVIERLHFVTWLLGAFLLWTALKLLQPGHDDDDPGDSWITRTARRFLPFTDTPDGNKFITRADGRWAFTPLFLVLVVIEGTDVVFAVDSIPAVLGLTHDPFIVYTSNVFAILGLRALYFVLADAVLRFHYMKHGLSVILAFVGMKMLLADIVHVPISASLGVILLALVVSGIASWVRERALMDARQEFLDKRTTPLGPGVTELSEIEQLMLLHETATFKGVGLDELRALLPGLGLREWQPNQPIFREGEEGDAFYVVVEGEVRIARTRSTGEELEIDVLGTGQHFGEMALFLGGPRSASATTLGRTRLLVLARDTFLEACTRHPRILLEVVRVLSERLREADAQLSGQTITASPAPARRSVF